MHNPDTRHLHGLLAESWRRDADRANDREDQAI
jgi:hypothetical protein